MRGEAIHGGQSVGGSSPCGSSEGLVTGTLSVGRSESYFGKEAFSEKDLL